MKKINLVLIVCFLATTFVQAQEPISDENYKVLLEKSPFNKGYIPEILLKRLMHTLMLPCKCIQKGLLKKRKLI